MLRSLLFDFRFLRRLMLALVLSSNLSCGGTNLFEQLSNKTTEQALYEAAVKYLDANPPDYDNAIASLNQIHSSFLQQDHVIKTLAGAYLGKCGALSFIELIDAMGGAGTPFQMMMTAFTTQTIYPEYCYSAQLAIESRFGTQSTLRSTDINLWMAILGMAKVGTYLRSLADTDQDGSVDGGFATACSIADPETQQIGSGLGLLLDNITALSSAIGGGGSVAALDALRLACGAACIITDPSSATWDATARDLIRAAIESNTYGIMACGAGLACCP